MLITDQVATAPCTDPIQDAKSSFEAKPLKPSLLRPALTLAAVLYLDVLFVPFLHSHSQSPLTRLLTPSRKVNSVELARASSKSPQEKGD